MARIEGRLRRLEQVTGEGDWRPFTPTPGPWLRAMVERLTEIRDNHPDPRIRGGSVMAMLGPEFKAYVENAAPEFEATHEWKWHNGRCYVRETTLAPGR